MAFPEAFVEEVRRAADIVRVISEHVPLRKMGTSWKGLCPFHQEKSPSFNVRSEPAVFHCFGCGEGGDVFKFLMLHERISFPEAAETLARRFGVPVPESRAEAGPDRKEREELLALLAAAAEHYTQHFWAAGGTRAREYLLGRGFQRETLERIRAGAAVDSWQDLLEALRRRFPVPALLTAGLVLQKDGRAYDRFRNRAVFPIANESGKIVGFGARSLDGSEPKYLNSPESPVYQKSRVLYGMAWAKDAMRREGRAVLMEGYLDVARALEAGVAEAVATCGTALTPGHARLLRRFTERVVVNFDQDTAGQRAARKSLDLLLDEGLKVHVVELPAGHDPDSYLKAEGADAYRRRLEEAPPYMEWLIRQAAAENDTRTPEGKAAFLNALLPSLTRLESAVERTAWLPAIVDRGGLDDRAAREEVRRALAAGQSQVSLPPPRPQAAPTRAALIPAERLLLALLLQGAEGAAAAVAGMDEELIGPLHGSRAFQAARKLLQAGHVPTLAAMVQVADGDEDLRRLLTEVAVEGSPETAVVPGECVRELKSRSLRLRMAQIQKELEAPAGPPGRENALLLEKQQLRVEMESL
jgi:DNA primase